jgi:hypothetical protein
MWKNQKKQMKTTKKKKEKERCHWTSSETPEGVKASEIDFTTLLTEFF